MITFKIKTLGCKVNQYEAQIIRERLTFAGYKEAADSEKADLCIVNTCTVTAKADKGSREILRRFMKENPKAEIIAAGCYAEKDSDTIKAIDSRIRVLNNRDKQDVGEILKDRDCRAWIHDICNDEKRPSTLARQSHHRLLGTSNTQYAQQSMDQGISHFKGQTKAFIKAQDGCNNFCSYCKVPYVRGRSKSRPLDEILREASALIYNNYRELVLTGICLGDFGKDLKNEVTLVYLVRELARLDGDFRIRLSSIELLDITEDLIGEMRRSKKICNHFHLPLQSGDDDILMKMNRRYTAGEFINKVELIRSKIPEVAITTDVIVGFPGESDRNFDNTVKTIKRVKPSRVHIFTYSPRKGTRAFEMSDTVSFQEKSSRHMRLKSLTDKFAKEFELLSRHKDQRVLIETARDSVTGMLTGYTDTYVRTLIDGPDKYIGQLVVKTGS